MRDRLLTEAELRIIWNACASDSDFDKIERLLMLTAARRTQIGDLSRTELKLDEAVIELPAQQGRTKNKQKFVLPLSRQAVAILKTVEAREGSDFVFGEGKGGFSGWSKCKLRLDETLKELGVENFVFHDFRTVFDTYAQDKLKIAPHITDLLLNHKGAEVRRGVRQHCNFASYLDEKIDAMDKWGDFIEGLTKPKKTERKVTANNVIPITSRR